jgi:AAHS family 4-hydroxybenzoate transporter-like MFS transporter
MRSTGIGWGSALGRIGAATGPLMGGALLSAGWMRPDVFSAVAVPILLSAVTAILFSVLVKRVFVRRAAALPSLSGE